MFSNSSTLEIIYEKFFKLFFQWLSASRLIEMLIEKLSHEGHPDEHSSIDQLLCDIVINSQDDHVNGSESQGSPSNGCSNKLLYVLER